MKELHVDIETYSSVDIKSCGAYRYFESMDFEILLIAYSFDKGGVRIVDLAQGENIPVEFTKALKSPEIILHAHNAAFERLAFKTVGLNTSIYRWRCSAVKASYCGLPLSLGDVSKALALGDDKAKMAAGKALIKFFCTPCKPTKVNGLRSRNFPEHDLVKWELFKEYCIRDVEAEVEIDSLLSKYPLPNMERRFYVLDQEINDRGVLIDTDQAKSAFKINEDFTEIMSEGMKTLTGVANPNSLPQLKEWIGIATKKQITSLAKEDVSILLAETENETVKKVLGLRQMLSKTSIKKYTAMLNCVCSDGRGHGFFQFYGAGRTGRWAGRLVQLQNLTRNYLPDLTLAKAVVRSGDHRNVELLYGDVSDTLSQLIRTTFIAPKGKTFAVADFSAIEARVIAWLAGEQWRLDVFDTHGKIYEASASSMFSIPIEEITKGSSLRQKGKVAELALGYQGSVSALIQMGGDKMGLSEDEMEDIVARWRKASPSIVGLWKELQTCAKESIKYQRAIEADHKGIIFECDNESMSVLLPSGRKLFYREPQLIKKRVNNPKTGESFEVQSITYMGQDSTTKQWKRLDTYGGKLTENIVQAIARDLLAESMLALDKEGFKIVMHVHDESVCEIDFDIAANSQLEIMCEIMSRPISWAPGLSLAADGYLTPYYKKD